MKSALQQELSFTVPAVLADIEGFTPFYETDFGRAYLADALDLLKAIPSNSVNLVVTSPPYALHFKKEYGNVTKQEYGQWFLVIRQGNSTSSN